MKILTFILFSALCSAQIQTVGGTNGLGHSTITCVDRDGDGFGIGPRAVISTTASGSISTGSQTITPASMTTSIAGVTTVSGSPVLTGISNLYTLQPGEAITGSGIPPNTTIVSISTGNYVGATLTPLVTLSANATASATITIQVGISVGTILRVDTAQNMEKVAVTAVAGTTFTGTFLLTHASGAVISDQGCLGPDADDLDPLVWSTSQVTTKYGSIANFFVKLGNDIVLENADGIAANAAARKAGLTSPNHTYWLSPSGSDSNNCAAIGTPCSTLAGLMTHGYASGGGDLIILRNAWDGALTLFSGNSSKQTVVISYPGEQANPVGGAHTANIQDTSYVWLENIEFSGGADISAGTTIGGATPPAITWHDNLYRHIDATGPFADLAGLNGFDQTNNVFEDSAYHDNSYAGSQHGIYIGSRTYTSTNITLQRLLVYNNNWNGLHFNGRCTGCMVNQAVSYFNGVSGLDFEQGWSHSTVQSSLIFSNAKQINMNDYESGQCPGRTYAQTFLGATTMGSPVITGVATGVLNLVQNGNVILANTTYGIPSGTTIVSFNLGTNTITMSASATTSFTPGSALATVELSYVSGQNQICPYPQNFNTVQNNTIYSTGNDAWPSFNTPGGSCASNVPDCAFVAINLADVTEIDPTNPAGAQIQADSFDHDVIRNNIIVPYGNNNNASGIDWWQQNGDVGNPYCDSNCVAWMSSSSLIGDLFRQSDGLGGIRVIQIPGTYYTCATAGAVVILSGCLDGDPMMANGVVTNFKNPASFDFRLLATSPALRAGFGTVSNYDLAGRAYVDSTPSLGALERNLYAFGWNDLGSGTLFNTSICAANGAPGGTNTNVTSPSSGPWPFQPCPQQIRTWSDGILRDSPGKSKQICWWGGGHSDYIGNEIYCTSFNLATPTIARIFGPSTYTGDPGTGATFSATVSSGAVTACAVTAGGSGYLGSGMVRWTPTGGDTITANAEAIFTVSGGAAATCTMANNGGGTGYNHAPTGSTQGYATPGSAWDNGDGTGGSTTFPTLAQLTDGSPNTTHSTGSLTYDPTRDRFLKFNGAVAGGNGHHFNDTFVYAFGAGWTRKDPTTCGSGTCNAPSTGGNVQFPLLTMAFSSFGIYNSLTDTHWYIADTGGGSVMGVYAPTSNTWSYGGFSGGVAVGGGSIDNGFGRAVIPDRQIAFMLGSNGGPTYKAYQIDLTSVLSSGYSALTDKTSSVSTSGGTSCAGLWQPGSSFAPGLDWNPALGKYVGYAANGAGTWYALDPDAYTCQTFAYSGGPVTGLNPFIYGRFRYSTSLDIAVLQQDYGQDAFVLSLNAPDPPTSGCNITPGSLPGGTVSTAYSQMLTANSCGGGTLTWTITTGGLPGGLSGCNGVTGTTCSIAGTPTTTSGSPFAFTIQVTDGGSNTASQAYSISTVTAFTLSSIAISDVGQHYCRVVGDVSPDAYVQLYYGTTSGGPYPYNTYVYLTGQKSPSDSGVFALDIGALASGATYYFVVRARPNIDNTTGQIQSAEGACTPTTGSPYPAAPVLYQPGYPNTTTGYTTIALTTSSGAFVAASTVTHTGGVFCAGDPSWTVTAGDSMTTILGEVRFGAIIEFPQGATGAVPNTNGFNGGYKLPAIAVDPCAAGIGDPNHRWVILRTHQSSAADFPPFGFRTGPAWTSNLANLQAQVPVSIQFAAGQIFWASLDFPTATPIHHFWLSNLEFSVNSASSNGPWGSYFAFGIGEGNSFDAQSPPSYMVLDRIYFNTPAPPAYAISGVFGTVGTDVMMTGNYVVGFQQASALAAGISISECSTGPLSILNNEVDAAGQGIYFEAIGYSMCGSRTNQRMQNAVVKGNAIYAPPRWLNPTAPGYGAWDGVTRGNFRNPFESKNCQICLITGNWIDGSFSGQNSGEAILLTPIPSANAPSGTTGMRDLEVSWNYVRHAAVFADVWGSKIIDASGGEGPDEALTSNILMHDNLAVDLGRYLYSIAGNAGGLASNYLNSYGVQNHLIYNNSFALTNGDSGNGAFFWIPDILGVSDGGIPSNGFQFTQNLLYFSQANPSMYSGIQAPATVCSGGCATFPVVPLPSMTTSATILQTTMVQIGSSVASSGTWGNNVVVCGNKGTGAEPWPDMTQSDCTTQAGNMPAGDLYPPGNTMAARQAAAGLLNVAKADLTVTPTASNFGGVGGANLQGVLGALEIVKNIAVLPGPGSLQFSYTAPDGNACSVDTSPNGITWTRSTASGGSRNQTVLVTSLSASTAYQYRLLCYYSQSRPWFSFPAESSNMSTEGSMTTAAPGTHTASVGFSFPSGAVSVKVTLTPLVGSAVSATCSSSPCVVAGVANGANQETIQYWSGAGATGTMLASGSTWLP